MATCVGFRSPHRLEERARERVDAPHVLARLADGHGPRLLEGKPRPEHHGVTVHDQQQRLAGRAAVAAGQSVEQLRRALAGGRVASHRYVRLMGLKKLCR